MLRAFRVSQGANVTRPSIHQPVDGVSFARVSKSRACHLDLPEDTPKVQLPTSTRNQSHRDKQPRRAPLSQRVLRTFCRAGGSTRAARAQRPRESQLREGKGREMKCNKCIPILRSINRTGSRAQVVVSHCPCCMLTLASANANAGSIANHSGPNLCTATKPTHHCTARYSARRCPNIKLPTPKFPTQHVHCKPFGVEPWGPVSGSRHLDCVTGIWCDPSLPG